VNPKVTPKFKTKLTKCGLKNNDRRLLSFVTVHVFDRRSDSCRSKTVCYSYILQSHGNNRHRSYLLTASPRPCGALPLCPSSLLSVSSLNVSRYLAVCDACSLDVCRSHCIILSHRRIIFYTWYSLPLRSNHHAKKQFLSTVRDVLHVCPNKQVYTLFFPMTFCTMFLLSYFCRIFHFFTS